MMTITISIDSEDLVKNMSTCELRVIIDHILQFESELLYKAISDHISENNIDELLEPIDDRILRKYAADCLSMRYEDD